MMVMKEKMMMDQKLMIAVMITHLETHQMSHIDKGGPWWDSKDL